MPSTESTQAVVPELLPPQRKPAAGSLETNAIGLLLFLFIPLVLFLFVRHPRPIGLCLAAGIVLMLGHRRLARPYMEKVLPIKCVWCNRILAAALDSSTRTLDLRSGGRTLAARCCAAHRAPAARFFALLDRCRWPLYAGIFGPLLGLLAALLASSLGWPRLLAPATALFQATVGATVSIAACSYRVMSERPPREVIPVPFPVHNFFLLGVRTLLWIFRLAGAWWIYLGAAWWLRR